MRRILVILGLLLPCLPAAAGEKTAVVYNSRPGPKLHTKVACSMLQTLMEAHYRIKSTSGESKLNFKIEAL